LNFPAKKELKFSRHTWGAENVVWMSGTQKLATVAGHRNFLNQVGSSYARRKKIENKTLLGIPCKAA
jgi:hypothetical protein